MVIMNDVFLLRVVRFLSEELWSQSRSAEDMGKKEFNGNGKRTAEEWIMIESGCFHN
jgi:hypothetical protein